MEPRPRHLVLVALFLVGFGPWLLAGEPIPMPVPVPGPGPLPVPGPGPLLVPGTGPVTVPGTGPISSMPAEVVPPVMGNVPPGMEASSGEPGNVPPKKPVRNWLYRHNLFCWTSHLEPGCGNFRSEFIFLFGSCRAFWGESCQGRPCPLEYPYNLYPYARGKQYPYGQNYWNPNGQPGCGNGTCP